MSAPASRVAVSYVVGVTGGSGSGKTTLVRGLVETLGAGGVAVLSHDAYYRDRGDLDDAARAAIDFDDPDAIDQPRFRADLARLVRGEAVCPPRYCFVTHRRLGDGAPVDPAEIVLVEGVLLLHDPEVRRMLDLAIFVDAPSLLRLRRRLARDTIERGRSAASVLRQFAETVAPAHMRYVEPTRHVADVVLSNVSRVEPLVEIAATLIRDRRAARREDGNGDRALA